MFTHSTLVGRRKRGKDREPREAAMGEQLSHGGAAAVIQGGGRTALEQSTPSPQNKAPPPHTVLPHPTERVPARGAGSRRRADPDKAAPPPRSPQPGGPSRPLRAPTHRPARDLCPAAQPPPLPRGRAGPPTASSLASATRKPRPLALSDWLNRRAVPPPGPVIIGSAQRPPRLVFIPPAARGGRCRFAPL